MSARELDAYLGEQVIAAACSQAPDGEGVLALGRRAAARGVWESKSTMGWGSPRALVCEREVYGACTGVTGPYECLGPVADAH